MKTQKGITLIALIITIIVMLILVGVSVSVALNTGLFKAAQGAAKNTEAERVNETKISEGKIQKEDGTWVDIEGYVDSLGAQTKAKEEILDYEKAIAAGYTHKISINVKTDEDGNLDENGTIDLGTYEYYIKENETTGADLANNTIEFSVKDGVLLFLDRFYVNANQTSWFVDTEAGTYVFDGRWTDTISESEKVLSTWNLDGYVIDDSTYSTYTDMIYTNDSGLAICNEAWKHGDCKSFDNKTIVPIQFQIANIS